MSVATMLRRIIERLSPCCQREIEFRNRSKFPAELHGAAENEMRHSELKFRDIPATELARVSGHETRISQRLGTDGGQHGSVKRETALPVILLRAREAIMNHMRPILRAHGVTEQQWRVLRVLDSKRPMDKTTLAERATLLMPSLLRILKDLEGCGLIKLVYTAGSARYPKVLLSAQGAVAVRRTTAAISAMGARVRKAIGKKEVTDLLNLLHQIEDRMLRFDA